VFGENGNHTGDNVFDGDVISGQDAHGCHARVANSTGDNAAIGIEGVVDVEREAVHGDALAHANTDGGDFVVREATTNPHATATFNAFAMDAEFAEHLNEKVFESAHVLHHVNG